uniref:Radial spoke head protein 9 homolog n=1 Tax=Physcomitrium patens TaxID=3218 RepID=A0A7I4BC01_PHYPA
MESNLTLMLEALAGQGCILPSEQRAALDISLKIKKQDAGLSTLALWGRVFTRTGNDYILAEGTVSAKRVDRKLVFDTKYYFTQDGVLWLDLQPPENDYRYALCKSAKGPFTGDPANVFLVVSDPVEPSEFEKRSINSMEMATELLLSFLLRFHSVLPSVVEPAVAGDKSSSSVTDEKTGSEADTEAPSESEPENDDNDEDPPGEPGEAQVIPDEEVVEGEGGGEGGAEGELEEIPAGVEVPELERLCGLMKWIDEECGVVPINSLVLTPHDDLIKNHAFTGKYISIPERDASVLEQFNFISLKCLSFFTEKILLHVVATRNVGPIFFDELDSYCHLFGGYMTAPLSKDLPG